MFKIKNVHHCFFHEISSNEILRVLFERFGAILAGGAAYSQSQGIPISKHLMKNTTADLDLYFSTEKVYRKAVEYIAESNKKYHVEKSITGMCYNAVPDTNNYYENSVDQCKIQLVGCLFGKPEDIITSFDFRNLEVCYYFSQGNYMMMYTDNNRRFSDRLDIRHSSSPFLMHRIYKYMTYRGFAGVTPRSKKFVTDWIVKASCGYYEVNRDNCPSIYVDLLDNPCFKKILKNRELIRNEDLALMIGKIKEDIVEGKKWLDNRGYVVNDFARVGVRDVVVEEIKSRETISESKQKISNC